MGKAKFSSTSDLPVTKDDMTQDDTLGKRSFFYSILLIRNDKLPYTVKIMIIEIQDKFLRVM